MKVDVISCMLDVLQSNQPVTLPGLGQWQVDHVRSEITGNRIYPPYKSILFNEKVGSSSSLATCIQEKYKISKKGAEQVIQRFSKLVINRLVNYREVYIPRLGTLKSNKEKSLNFQEDQPNVVNAAREYLPSFGLIPVEKEVVAATTTPVITPVIAPKNSTKSSMVRHEEKNTLPQQVYYGEEKGCLARFFWPLFWLLLLGILCFFFIKKCSSSFNGSGDSTALVNGENDKSGENGELSNSDTKSIEGFDAEKEYLVSELDQIPDAIFEQGCVIIVGSYRKSCNVIRMKAQLRAQGKDVFTEVIPSGLTRVGFNLDCDRESVVDLIKSARIDLNSRSWYLKPKLKVPR